MIDYATDCSNKQNFKISYQGAEYVDGKPTRGAIVCSPKSAGRRASRCANFPFRLKFRLRAESGKFEFMPPFTLTHSHSIGNETSMEIDGMKVIQFEQDLTDAEICAIESFSVCGFSVPLLETQLERIFPNRLFHKQLLARVRNKTLDERFGKDRNNLPALAGLSEQVVRDGGIFQIVLDPDSMGIKSIHVQKKSWRGYVDQYGCDGPKMVDGSHDWSKHKVIAIPWTSIDGLGLSCIQGVTFNISENADAIIEGANLFFRNSPTPMPLDSSNLLKDSLEEFAIMEQKSDNDPNTIIAEESTIMSDEGPAFPSVAISLGCHHIKDRKHFTAQIITSWQQVPQEQREQYKNDIHCILNARTIAEFSRLMTIALSRYQIFPEALAYLKKIHENKEHYVWAYTSQYFTVGHVSDQRSEVTNSTVKGHGSLKHHLKNSPLYDAIKRLFMVSRNWDKKGIDQLKTLRLSSYFIGEKYYSHLQASKNNVIKYSHCVRISPGIFEVKEHESSSESCVVNLHGSLKFCGQDVTCITGTCNYFKSTRMICECACRAAQEENLKVPQAYQIYPYYLVYNHPKYAEACRMLGLSTQIGNLPNPMPNYINKVEATAVASMPRPNEDCIDNHEDAVYHLNSKLYDQVGDHFANLKKGEMVMKYRSKVEEMKDLATKSTKHFKIVMCELAGLENKLSSLSLGSSLNASCDAISRARKRGKQSIGELGNKSFLQRENKVPKLKTSGGEVNFHFVRGNSNQKKSSTQRSCKACKNAGRPASECIGHISTSKHCPSRIFQYQSLRKSVPTRTMQITLLFIN